MRPAFKAIIPTLGGRQFWGDEYVRAGWHIQSNVLTGKFRLLSPAKLRFEQGSYEGCLEALREQHPKPNPRRVTFMLHGLARSWASFDTMTGMLQKNGVEADALTYPSTRASIQDHAVRLIRILTRLEDVAEIDFVTHSMGGIVLRHALNLRDSWPRHIRARKIAMLAPPYKGAAMARLFKDVPPVRAVLGDSLDDLAQEADAFDIPESIALLIVAGGMNDGRGLNPLIDGDDDGTVAVLETRPERPHEFRLIKAQHSLIMNNDEAGTAVLDFLIRD